MSEREEEVAELGLCFGREEVETEEEVEEVKDEEGE